MWKFLLIMSVIFSPIYGANILALFPTPSISHQVVLRALTDGLEDRGHTLTIVSTDPDTLSRNHPNTTEIDLHFAYDTFRRAMNFVELKESKVDELKLFDLILPKVEPMSIEIFERPEILKLIKSRNDVKFDVVIVEYLGNYQWFAFAEWFNAPLIGITSLDTMNEIHEAMGNAANPVVQPDLFSPFIENLDFSQRYRSLRYYLWHTYYYGPKFNKIMEKIVNRYMPGLKTPIKDLKGKAELLMTNTHPALGFIRPLLPTTIQLGFMHIKPPKPITDVVLKNYLDNSDKPIIYMSLGSNVRSSDMHEGFVNIFLNVFKDLPYNVIWKWEIDHMKNKPDNVFIHKWLPQADLLAHPNIKLFITQGGQQSFEEAIDRTVPLIVMPFLADQDANAKRAKKLKVGVALELHTLSEENLTRAINEIINGEYKKNIVKLREIVYDVPMNSVDKAVWWVEYCIRHKGMKHLDYSGKYVPFYQKYFLDFIGIALVSLLVAVKVLLLIVKLFFGSKKVKKE